MSKIKMIFIKIYWFFRDRKNELLFCLNSYIIPSIPFWPLRNILYKIQGMKLGKGSRILMKTRVVCPQNIEIGENTFVNECCFLDGRSGIKIGNDVTIAIYSKIITGGHNIDNDTFEYKGSNVVIGNNVAVFANSVILGGAKIEDGCVFSAGSIIRKGEYRRLGVYAGNPAAYIRKRNSNLKYSQDFWKPIFR